MAATVTDLIQLHEGFKEEGIFQKIATTQLLQFGTASKQMLGARILPERSVALNNFEEDQVRWRTFPALDSTRYSPAQLQDDGLLVGSYQVRLGYQNTASQLTAARLDNLLLAIENNQTGATSADSRLIDFFTNLVNRVMVKNEIQRWEAMLLRNVKRTGTGGYQDIANYPIEDDSYWVANVDKNGGGDGSGTASDPKGWFAKDESYDPIAEDFLRAKDLLEDKGYRINNIYMDRVLANVFQRNPVIQRLANARWTVTADGDVGSVSQRASRAMLNGLMNDNELPGITVYNLGYQLPTSYARYIKPLGTPANRHFVLITAETDQDTELYIEEKDESIILDNTMGYFAVGTCSGEPAPGRRSFSRVGEQHPVNVYGEVIQASLPVIQHPQALITIAVDKPAEEGEDLDQIKSVPALYRDFAVA